MEINLFAPKQSHGNQDKILDDPSRFKVIVAGRKFWKTATVISWLFKGALETKLLYPYIAPSKVQAKNIVWDDHINRILIELKKHNVPYKTNETELSVEVPGRGKIQLFGVENKEALRGMSNWGAIGCDEYDDWREDIWPLIIRPNLIPHQAPAMVVGTPKGFKNLYALKNDPTWKYFHYTTYDNPSLPKEELDALVAEYKEYGEEYYRQEILAEFVKFVGMVYKEWQMETRFIELEYDPILPVHITFDWGVNEPTAVIWLQPLGLRELRVIDYYEASDASIEHFISVINSKPYKKAELYTGDPAGKARTLTTGTSVIDELAKKGIHVKTKDGVKIPEQIRITHGFISRLYVSNKLEHFRDCLLNYRYPTERKGLHVRNEIPIHDEWSHAMRALEYYCINVRDRSIIRKKSFEEIKAAFPKERLFDKRGLY